MLCRGGVALKWISPLGTSTWNLYTLCGRFNLMLYRGGVALKWISPLGTSTWNLYTLCGRFNQCCAEGVWLSNGLAHWALPHEISTPSVVDWTWCCTEGCGFQMDQPIGHFHMKFLLCSRFNLMLYRGGVAFKWISPLGVSTWNFYSLCSRFNLMLYRGGGCDSQIESLNVSITLSLRLNFLRVFRYSDGIANVS